MESRWTVRVAPRTVRGQFVDNSCTIRGHFKDSPWGVHRQSVGCPQTVCGVSMDSPWGPAYSPCTARVQFVHSPCTVRVLSVGKTVHGPRTDCLWTPQEFAIDAPRTVHSMGSRWHVHGVPMESPWMWGIRLLDSRCGVRGVSVNSLRTSHGHPKDCP